MLIHIDIIINVHMYKKHLLRIHTQKKVRHLYVQDQRAAKLFIYVIHTHTHTHTHTNSSASLCI